MPRKKITPLNEDFDPKLFATIAKKYFSWFLGLLVTALIIAFLYLRYTPPTFESQSVVKLSVENQAKEIFSSDKQYFLDQQNQLAGNVELMRSKLMADRVVKRLPMKVSYYVRGRLLDNELYRSSPFKVEILNQDSIPGSQPFFVRFKNLSEFQIASNEDFKEDSLYRNASVNEWLDLAGMQFKIMLDSNFFDTRKPSTLYDNLYYFKVNDPGKMALWISGKVNISVFNPDAKTISIKFSDHNSRKAMDIANMLATEFISFDVEKNKEVTNNILAFIENTIASVNDDLIYSEGSIENFRKMNKLMDPGLTVNQVSGKVWELQNKLIDLKLELNIFENLKKDVNQYKEISQIILSIVGKYKDGAIVNSIAELQNMLNQRDQIALQATQENQIYKAAVLKLENQKRMLLSLLENEQSILMEEERKIENQLKEFEGLFSTMPGKQAEYSRLQRVFDINEKFYSLLLEKKAEFSIAAAGFVPKNILLVAATETNNPVSPNKKLVLSICLILGIFSSFIIIFVKYLFYNEISSLEEIEMYTDASLLGVIPKYKREIPVSQLLIDKNPKSVIAEAFRSLRTNMQFIGNEAGLKTIAVTSTISGEGKTFNAINLAGVIAFSGKRVIILDLDMRKPKIHLGFNVENHKGISTLLIGKDKPEDCIRPSSLPNLDFITAGPVPPNPSELIINPNMDKLIEFLKSKYDIIIMDTPPVGIVSDGIPIVQKVDFPLYIIRANYSRKMFIHNVNKLLNENKIRKLSIILNGVEMQKLKYGYGYGYGYGSGYGYGYTYGYGYGYYEEDYSEPTLMDKVKAFFSRSGS